jgi:inorganic phosphate transporter, PiT family
MVIIFFVLISVLFLSYSNGSNDNFKGVATLFGSRTVGYKKALYWATVTTFAGSVFSIFLSKGLVSAFSGIGLIDPVIASNPSFVIAIGLGAASTVFIATIIGIPISTTHSLTGALVGAGIASIGTVNLLKLGNSFFLPLAISPLLALALTAAVYPVFRRTREFLGIEKETCVCLEGASSQPVFMRNDGSAILKTSGKVITVSRVEDCEERYYGELYGIDAQSLLDKFHYLSSGMVSFARGLNDTPKIVALLVTAKAVGMDLKLSMLMVGIAMGIGGLLNARKVATTMSDNIVKMNHGQGFTANLVTAFLVIIASKLGIPVSTTHVSCGSLFGLGAVTKNAKWKVIRTIVFAWIITLPAAATFSVIIYYLASYLII